MKINALRDAVIALCFLVLLLLIALKIQADAEIEFAGNFRTADGDSLVQADRRLRLQGIDAPELAQTCLRGGKTWPCGRAAQQALATLVASGRVSCRGARDDRYGRLLVTCLVDTRNINREMVVRGMAFAFGAYEAEEAVARKARIGLWAGEVVPPSEWRRRHQIEREPETPHLPSLLARLFGGS